jgi:type IV pilus assembly protein PilV
MQRLMPAARAAQRGTSLVEVLVTLVITSYGLLGLTGLMNGMYRAESEGFARSQALMLLADMTDRITAGNPQTGAAVAAYADLNRAGLVAPAGTGDNQPADCSALAAGGVRDVCEWSSLLKGAAEKLGGNPVGSIHGARGCIELLAAPDATTGICTPATFRVSVAWQGTLVSAASSNACGRNLYGSADGARRVLAEQVTVGLPLCTVNN